MLPNGILKLIDSYFIATFSWCSLYKRCYDDTNSYKSKTMCVFLNSLYVMCYLYIESKEGIMIYKIEPSVCFCF